AGTMEALFIGVSFCPGCIGRGTWQPGKPPTMQPFRRQGSCRRRSIKAWKEGRPAARACGRVVSFRYCSEALNGQRWRAAYVAYTLEWLRAQRQPTDKSPGAYTSNATTRYSIWNH